MITICHTVKELQAKVNPLKQSKQIAFVPTMGNLHAGHISLVEQARNRGDVVVVSIFVNPTQFGEGEDFDSYPRTLEQDVEKLEAVGTDIVFAPSVEEMYPNFPRVPNTQVKLGELTHLLCGQSRQGHFDGVGLVVSKLFNIVQPDIAVFGKKDYQQLALIRQLVVDLNFPIEIVGGEIVRAEDGLALSSRNQYLSEEHRKLAPTLNKTISELADELANNINGVYDQADGFEEQLQDLIQRKIHSLNTAGFKVDYLEVKSNLLQPATYSDKNLVILVAAWCGKARLLDNVEVAFE